MPIQTIVSGDAVHFPKNGDSCLIHYIGYLDDGTEFDNSYRRDRPLCVLLGAEQLISGLEKTLTKMSRGAVTTHTTLEAAASASPASHHIDSCCHVVSPCL